MQDNNNVAHRKQQTNNKTEHNPNNKSDKPSRTCQAPKTTIKQKQTRKTTQTKI